ncbi:YeeE/YedE family protein [Rhodovibrionaceae bacterium A322]
MELEAPQLVALAGFVVGLAMGVIARSVRFCTFGAIEAWVLVGRHKRLRTWGLAIAVATLIFQVSYFLGVERLYESFYLTNGIRWGGAIVGGLIFGIGMAMAGFCGFSTLVRVGGGDLKALVVALVMGLSAYMTARGLTGSLRELIIEPLTLPVSPETGSGLAGYVAQWLGLSLPDAALWCGVLVAGLIIIWAFSNGDYRRSGRDALSGLLMGLTVGGAFLATAILGNDDFDPQQVESVTYSLPPGEALVYLMTSSGSSLSFAVTMVFGTILGSFVTTASKGELRLEGYDDLRELRRHLIGAFLMGVGGVTAMGCTIGQGISGMATLSFAAPLALGGIFVGAIFSIGYLMTGQSREAVSYLYERFRKGAQQEY